jgi:hypothetical protein
MRQLVGLRYSGLMLAFAAFLFLGCGAGTVKVEGNLVKDGQPYTPQAGENVSLSFNGKNAEGEPMAYPAAINASNGSFVVKAPDGGGVPPGTYKVHMSIAGGSDPESLAKAAKTNEQFKALNDKDVQIAAGDSGKKITIDIAKGTVTK